MKPCYRCKAAPRTGTVAYCRPCQTLNMREWRATNPERDRENGKRSDTKRRSENVAKFSAKRRERHMRWQAANPEESRKRMLSKYRRTRDRAIERLGGRCACCAEKRATMLHIDHIHNDGYLEGKSRRSYTLIRKVLSSDNPHKKYQILCANCNHSKARNHGYCEHYTEKWMMWISEDAHEGQYPYGVKQ